MRTRTLLTAIVLAALLFVAAAAPAAARHEPGHDGGPPACRGKGRRACEVPEVPVVAALPLAALAAGAGYYGYTLVRRRGGRRVDAVRSG